MQRLCSTLWGLLAYCPCSWGPGDCFPVVQSPPTLTLTTGGNAQLFCSWNISGSPKVRWFKDNQRIDSNRTNKFGETRNGTRAALAINRAAAADAGVYICEVTQDIPRLRKENGTGTSVTYAGKPHGVPATTAPGSGAPQETTATAAGATVGAAVAAATLLLFIGVCVWRMKRGYTQSERAVVREGPPSEGEEPKNDEGGATSVGSTQWRTVPVYESYFDLHRGDGANVMLHANADEQEQEVRQKA